MRLKDVYANKKIFKPADLELKKPALSFEIFPPKDDFDGTKLDKLIEHLRILKKYSPDFISLTYGAGGSTRGSSIEIIKKIRQELDLNIMPHFTCVATEKKHIDEYLKNLQEMGIENILALRGDIPQGMDPESFDFRHANEIVEYIKSKTNLSVGVAGYPEGHISCNDFDVDMKYLKRKVNAGADAIFTQMFFDNEKFFEFRDYAKNIGIKAPITAGIMIIRGAKQLEKMLSMGRITLPKDLKNLIEKHKDNSDDIKKIGTDYATKQCQILIEKGVSGLHFYTLNSSKAICEVLDNIGF